MLRLDCAFISSLTVLLFFSVAGSNVLFFFPYLYYFLITAVELVAHCSRLSLQLHIYHGCMFLGMNNDGKEAGKNAGRE